MSERINEEELLQTTCTDCDSVFHLNLSQLLAADGRVRCGECHEIFDANIHLVREKPVLEPKAEADDIFDELIAETQSVSLHEAMNEGEHSITSAKKSSFIWALGILALVAVSFLQWIYFDRLNIIKNPNKQQFVLSLCSIIPCDNHPFKSTQQFSLIERNIFTHPTQANALLISGSFVNEAPFTQPSPTLKISLFNLNGEVIAQRQFLPLEYSQSGQAINSIAPGEIIQFNLEVEDPNTVTITYEFEFL